MSIRNCCIAILVICFGGVLGYADQLLVNPGFETGDFSGWTVFRPAPGSFGGTPIYGVATAGTPISGNAWRSIASPLASPVLPITSVA